MICFANQPHIPTEISFPERGYFRKAKAMIIKMKRILTILTAAFLAVTLCLGSSACTFGRRDPGEIGDTENEETLPPVDPAQLPGIVAGRVYINRFFGLRLDLDSKWTMMTEEELEKMNHEAVEALPGGYSSAAEGTDYFCDMSASANGGFHAIRVVVQNLHGGDANITEKVIAEQTALVISESYGNS